MTSEEWAAAQAAGQFEGAPNDKADGFVHLSTAQQVGETLARHLGGRNDLRLVTVDLAALGETLRWEPARGGDLFPHVYGPLPLAAMVGVCPIPDGLASRIAFTATLT